MLGCMLTSCKTDSSITEQLSLIPGDATIVFEINGNEIFAKSGLNTPDDYKFINILKLANADIYSFFESLLKNSKEAGISAQKILGYMSKLPDVTLSILVTDRTAFENWLKKANLPEPSQEGEFSYISIDGDANIAWNDNLMVISGTSTREGITEHFKPKADGLLAKNTDFKRFVSKNADIRLWFRNSALKNLLFFGLNNPDDESINNPFLGLELYANLSTHSYLSFENGKIVGKSSLYPPEEIEKLKEKLPVFKSNFNTEILKNIPERSYFAFNMSIDFKEYVKIIRQNIESGYMYIPELKRKGKELIEFFDSPELKIVLESLGGDLFVNIHGFNKSMFSYPMTSASFTVNSETAFNDILKLIPKNLYSKQDGYYSMFIPIYFAYKDDIVLVTTDLDVIKTFTGAQKAKDTFVDNPISKLMTNKMVLYFDLNFSDYPENIKMLLQNFMGDKYKLFTSAIEIYDHLYLSSDTQYNTEFNLQLKNKNVNALKQILKNIDKTSSSLWMN
jgi:hypothetical protein